MLTTTCCTTLHTTVCIDQITRCCANVYHMLHWHSLTKPIRYRIRDQHVLHWHCKLYWPTAHYPRWIEWVLITCCINRMFATCRIGTTVPEDFFYESGSSDLYPDNTDKDQDKDPDSDPDSTHCLPDCLQNQFLKTSHIWQKVAIKTNKCATGDQGKKYTYVRLIIFNQLAWYYEE